MKSKSRTRFRQVIRPYRDQFKRSPIWVKIVAVLCLTYILIPIDLFDILFPWMAYSDDLFIAGILLRLLHKYGGLPDEDKTTPIELIKKILGTRQYETIHVVYPGGKDVPRHMMDPSIGGYIVKENK